MNLEIIPATLHDVDFITTLVMSGARKGHFESKLAEDKPLVRKIAYSILKDGRLYENGRPCHAMVAWWDNKRAGAIILAETGLQDHGIELYLIAVKKEFQGSGHGKVMLDSILQKWLPLRPVYVRCFPGTDRFYCMLTRRGFAEYRLTEKGTRFLRHNRDHQPVTGQEKSVISYPYVPIAD